MATRGLTGRFIPKNPNKYVGDIDAITFRSSWERRMFEFLDNNPNVLAWASEEIPFVKGVDDVKSFTGNILYVKPTDGRVHRYFPDIFAVIQDAQGNVGKYLIEIKPAKETGLQTKRLSLEDKLTIAVNHAKWSAAKKYCEERGFQFKVLTEHELFGKKR